MPMPRALSYEDTRPAFSAPVSAVLAALARFRDLLLQRVHGLGVRVDDLVRLVVLDAHCPEHLSRE